MLLGTSKRGRSLTGYRKVVNIHNVQCNRRMTVRRLERLDGGINNGGLAPSRYLTHNQGSRTKICIMYRIVFVRFNYLIRLST